MVNFISIRICYSHILKTDSGQGILILKLFYWENEENRFALLFSKLKK